jgi:hypothetical protein
VILNRLLDLKDRFKFKFPGYTHNNEWLHTGKKIKKETNMGDKGKKDKEKGQKQKTSKQGQKAKIKQDKQPKKK